MKLPAKNIGGWAKEIIDQCTASREQRRDQARAFDAWFYCGTGTGDVATYNRIYSHIDRLSSYLFSPVDTRFLIEYDLTVEEVQLRQAEAAARYLNREFHRCGVDLMFAEGVNMGLRKGCALLKMVWGWQGLEPWIVRPEMFGVLREDIEDLDRQEAFVESTYLTRDAFRRTIGGHHDEAEILKAVDKQMTRPDDEDLNDSYFRQIIIGGTQPVGTTPGSGLGQVQTTNIPAPQLDAKVAKDLIRIDELWVQDTARNDYTTIRTVGDVVIEGKLKHENLSGVPEEHPYVKVCPNEVNGYFWGLSEISQIQKLQALLNKQMDEIDRLLGLKSDPPTAFIGFSGMTQQKWRALRTKGGYMSEENPNAKIEKLAPDVPPETWEQVNRICSYFDDVAGFAPIMMGQGEQGVRAGVHAQTLSRNASPRMRDRALLVERQCVEAGDFGLKLIQSKEAKVLYAGDTQDEKNAFEIAQLPEDYRVSVDSHTSSPAFQEDAERKAFMLARAGAIDAPDLIMLTHPPHEDTLVSNARKKLAAQAKLMAEHPELMLGKGKARGGRK